MKNFKKVLALVLVLATLLGLATMASATEYKDADKIDGSYDEAVKVLDLIETMQGYPNGEFRPTANITREEAAKLIAIFDNKDADISTYYTSINPFADEKGRWGESYVGYGYRAGIIAGMNATTFAPTANVTGTQFLKMALVTLGYDQEAEGFVGSSWAVNVLALARRLNLIDGLKDGWKPENDLTREEAAQILLNTLNAETVEYGQETKAFLNKNSIEYKEWKDLLDKEGYFRFNGKLYLTVAGAVKTGKYMYEGFGLKKSEKNDDMDAFGRPYTKWTKDDKSVKVMKTPKATFTTKFSACDLLVALGIKENNIDDEITIGEIFINGDDKIGSALFNMEDKDGNEYGEWKHSYSNCKVAKAAKHGAQGTLTQVFKMEDENGDEYYRVCSIDTWLAKVSSVTTKTTARDDHLRYDGSVKMSTVWTLGANGEYGYNRGYCGYEGGEPGHCQKLPAQLTYDDPTGLAKNDYVLVTYSFMKETGKDKVKGVQSVDVAPTKDAEYNGYKNVVTGDPTETRIDGEFVKDAQHFHMGYNLSKKWVGDKDYGTYTFYFDAYGNVIGMKDAKTTTNWAVIDNANIVFDEDGNASLKVKVVDADTAKTTSGIAKKFNDINNYADFGWTAADVDWTKLDQKDLAYTLAVALKALTNGEGNKDFEPIYDHLVKVSVDSEGKYTIKAPVDGPNKYLKAEGSLADVTAASDEITVVNGRAYLTDEDGDDMGYVLTSSTQFLVHKMDGTYAAYTGYKNVPSMIAHYAEIVVTEEEGKTFDQTKKIAEVVYLTNEVYTTDGKVVAYVGKAAQNNVQYVNSEEYHALTIYVDGEAKEIYIDDASYTAYFMKAGFEPGFYEFLNTDADGVTVAKAVTKFAAEKDAEYLDAPVEVLVLEDEEIKVGKAKDGVKTYSYAKDVAFYIIDENKVEKSTLADLQYYFGLDKVTNPDPNGPLVTNAHDVYMSVDGTEATAIYLICEFND